MKMATPARTEFIKPGSTYGVMLWDTVVQPCVGYAGKFVRGDSRTSGLSLLHDDVVVTKKTSSLHALYLAMEKKKPGSARQVMTLKLQDANLSSLDGIEFFPLLTRLQVQSHMLTDISSLVMSKELVSLDLSGCSQLLDLRPLKKSGLIVLKIKDTLCNNFSVKALLGLRRLRYLDVSGSNVDRNNDFQIIKNADRSVQNKKMLFASLRLAEKMFMRNFIPCDYDGHFGERHLNFSTLMFKFCQLSFTRKLFPELKNIRFESDGSYREVFRKETKALCTEHLKRLVRKGIRIIY